MTPNRFSRRITVFVLQTVVACSLGLVWGPASPAQGPANPVDREQFRRTVDPSERGPFGTLALKKNGGQQTVQVLIQNLGDKSWGVYFDPNPTFVTNQPVFGVVGQLDRIDPKHGIWLRRFVGNGGAPPEFADFGLPDLDNLAGHSLGIAQPGPTNLVGCTTNLVGCTTNIVGTMTNLVGCTTNLVGCTTNFFVEVVLWAPLNALTTSPSALSYFHRTAMVIPEEPLIPAPKARGTITTKFNGPSGRSVLNVHATGLLRGQVYRVLINDGPESSNFILAGDMVLDKIGTTGSFIRDTKFGDPLPQQMRSVADLAGRTVLILDEFNDLYLVGLIP